jgi:hypothetical protein
MIETTHLTFVSSCARMAIQVEVFSSVVEVVCSVHKRSILRSTRTRLVYDISF